MRRRGPDALTLETKLPRVARRGRAPSCTVERLPRLPGGAAAAISFTAATARPRGR